MCGLWCVGEMLQIPMDCEEARVEPREVEQRGILLPWTLHMNMNSLLTCM
jgi:hypothetical protein